jgi:hypothetical protein
MHPSFHYVRQRASRLTCILATACWLTACRDKQQSEGLGASGSAPLAIAPKAPVQMCPTAPVTPAPAAAVEPSTLVFAWAGKGPLGYVRVELWTNESTSTVSTQELRVAHADGSVLRHKGRLIRLPDKNAAADVWQAFILSRDGDAYRNPYPDFLASVSPDGVMRLYEFSTPDGSGAFDLPPVQTTKAL